MKPCLVVNEMGITRGVAIGILEDLYYAEMAFKTGSIAPCETVENKRRMALSFAVAKETPLVNDNFSEGPGEYIAAPADLEPVRSTFAQNGTL